MDDNLIHICMIFVCILVCDVCRLYVYVCILVMQAREAVETRAKVEKQLASKKKEEKEEKLRMLAQKARDERAGIRTAAGMLNSHYLRTIEGNS